MTVSIFDGGTSQPTVRHCYYKEGWNERASIRIMMKKIVIMIARCGTISCVMCKTQVLMGMIYCFVEGAWKINLYLFLSFFFQIEPLS